LNPVIIRVKGLSIRAATETEKIGQSLDLGPLSEILTFQELIFGIHHSDDVSFPFYNDFLGQVQTLTNLTSLTISFYGPRDLNKELKLDISSLCLLKVFELELFYRNYHSPSELSNQIWLEEIFRAIGQKSKLKKLLLSFSCFSFSNFGYLFMVLGQSLNGLVNLSSLSLSITKSNCIGAEDLCALFLAISKLDRIQDLELRIDEDYDFLPKIFYALIDLVANSFPILSSPSLEFGNFYITQEACRTLTQAIKRKKSLNHVFLLVFGQVEPGVDLGLLWSEIQKRISIYIALPSRN